MSTSSKFSTVIADGDILIHLARADQLDILYILFDKVYIPKYVYDREIKIKAGRYLKAIQAEIGKIFDIIDHQNDLDYREYKNVIEAEMKYVSEVVGRGEAYCQGISVALGIPIVISDNINELKWLDVIMLTHYGILTLCVKFRLIKFEEAKERYDKINSILDNPSGKTFEQRYQESKALFINEEWITVLKIK